MAVTTIKRIKAKILLKESLTGKIIYWSIKVVKKIINKENYIYARKEKNNNENYEKEVIEFFLQVLKKYTNYTQIKKIKRKKKTIK